MPASDAATVIGRVVILVLAARWPFCHGSEVGRCVSPEDKATFDREAGHGYLAAKALLC